MRMWSNIYNSSHNNVYLILKHLILRWVWQGWLKIKAKTLYTPQATTKNFVIANYKISFDDQFYTNALSKGVGNQCEWDFLSGLLTGDCNTFTNQLLTLAKEFPTVVCNAEKHWTVWNKFATMVSNTIDNGVSNQCWAPLHDSNCWYYHSYNLNIPTILALTLLL